MQQFLFYQHNVQRFFISHLAEFSGVIAPLSIVTAFPDGTHGFLLALFAKDSSKQFMIDPRTPLFQHAWNRENVRDPHRKMAKVFGGPFLTKGLSSKIEPHDLTDETVTSVTQACIEYQQKFRLHKQQQKKIEKYKKLLGIDHFPQMSNPQILIPPYFEFANYGDAWYSASMKCNGVASSIAGIDPQSLRPVLHFSDFGSSIDWSEVVADISSLGITSVFLYPNDFHEHDATDTLLGAYTKAVRAFKEAAIEPFALHGGYFSISLSKRGLAGFGNGVGYGEWRNSGYHRGGTAEKRIYILKLHRFLEPAKAQTLIDQNEEYFGLDTDLLAECVASDRPLDDISLEEALDHFMDCRQQEMNFVGASSVADIRAELSDTIDVLDESGDLYGHARSLRRWRAEIDTW